jgi:type IV pilus assembly protein PilB
MTGYSPDVAERLFRILEAAKRLDKAALDQTKADCGSDHAQDWLTHMIDAGTLKEELVQTILSRAYAIRRANLNINDVDIRAIGLVPPDFIDKNSALPFAVEDRFLKVAIIDPSTVSLSGELRSLSRFNIEFHLISLGNFRALREHQKIIQILDASRQRQETESHRHERSRFSPDNDEQVPAFVDHILNSAISNGTSDIHIEPFRDTTRVRFRMDGRLKLRSEYAEYLTKNYQAVATRLKIMADCDISEKRLPQDGAITISYRGEDVDFRFNVLPGKNGERIVMRILKGDPALSLDRIGLRPNDFQTVINAITAPQGMVLVTGPTGSGKTTTLYGALRHINDDKVNIMTAEDPVEYYLEGIGQVQANEKIGLNFAAILRAFLRQDPEVILIGEIRDQETLDTAIKAALTGHLLLSTLHTNDAIATITRLLNMGVPHFMVTAAVTVIVAQRLARANCPNCLTEDTVITTAELENIGFSMEDIETITPTRGAGCRECDDSGYKGRRGIYEVLSITPSLEEAILNGSHAQALLSAAKQDGFQTMQDMGREMIRQHILSVEEFARVIVLG